MHLHRQQIGYRCRCRQIHFHNVTDRKRLRIHSRFQLKLCIHVVAHLHTAAENIGLHGDIAEQSDAIINIHNAVCKHIHVLLLCRCQRDLTADILRQRHIIEHIHFAVAIVIAIADRHRRNDLLCRRRHHEDSRQHTDQHHYT